MLRQAHDTMSSFEPAVPSQTNADQRNNFYVRSVRPPTDPRSNLMAAIYDTHTTAAPSNVFHYAPQPFVGAPGVSLGGGAAPAPPSHQPVVAPPPPAPAPVCAPDVHPQAASSVGLVHPSASPATAAVAELPIPDGGASAAAPAVSASPRARLRALDVDLTAVVHGKRERKAPNRLGF